MYKLLKQLDRQKNNQLQKRSPIFKSLLTIGAIAGITVVVMPFEANGQQCIEPLAGFNSSNYVIDTPLQGATNPTTILSFFNGAMQFTATRNGTATWSLGVRVRSDAGPLIGNYLFLQPQNANNYLITGNSVTYELTFPTPLTSLSLSVAGLNNNDGTTVTAFNGATVIPITPTNFSALSPASPPAALGLSVIPPNTVVGTSTLGGTQVDTNSYLLTIPGPVTRVSIVSGKNEVGNNSTVTIGFTTFNICYATLSGTVFEDTNGSQIQNGGEVGTNAGGLNAVLVNSSNNQVVNFTAVAADGTYSFNNVVPGTFTVRITTATATVGAAPPAVTLPTNWVTTGENLNGTIDGTPNSIIPVTVTPANITGINLGIRPVPSLNLVKRITAINGTDINTFVDGPNTATSNDNDPNWPSLNTQYLRGAIACPTIGLCPSVRPSDLIEYTIYFLSNGASPASNVQLCDQIPANTVFQPNTYGSGSGILLGWNVLNGALPLPNPANSTVDASKVALNNVPDADAGQFLAANVSVTNAPAPCNNGALNPNGAILVRLGADIPPATLGTPTNSYGFIRFRVRVN